MNCLIIDLLHQYYTGTYQQRNKWKFANLDKGMKVVMIKCIQLHNKYDSFDLQKLSILDLWFQ